MTSDDRKREVLADLAALRPEGKAAPRWDYMAGLDVEYVAALNELYRVVHSARILPAKYREIIISVLLASRLYDRLPVHLGRALDAGATEGELLEALEIAQTITGMPTLLFGVDSLKEVVAERKAANP
jgi:alkylhydroperoxidase/carboxymuconolactone decarboxylase family protein YurZ